jgi:hypothetical protein
MRGVEKVALARVYESDVRKISRLIQIMNYGRKGKKATSADAIRLLIEDRVNLKNSIRNLLAENFKLFQERVSAQVNCKKGLIMRIIMSLCSWLKKFTV